MPAKRKADKEDKEEKEETVKRRKTDANTSNKRLPPEGSSSGSDSDSAYEPSESEASASESESDEPTSSESESSGSEADSSQGSSSGSSSGDDDADTKEKGEKEDEKKVEGRDVGGRTMRGLKEDRPKEEDSLKLSDLAQEHLILSVPAYGRASLVACLKGRVYTRLDRVRINGELAEIQGFWEDGPSMQINWLLSAEEAHGSGVRHGNFLRVTPDSVIPLTSMVELEHEPTEKAGVAATLKITHQAKIKIGPKSKAELFLRRGEGWEVNAVAGDKGRWRPNLYGTERRWNAGEQKKLLLFLRRVWPECQRPASVTIAMDPPAHKDSLAGLEDEEDDVRDIVALTEKYRAIWDATVRRTDANAANAQRWMANTFDSLRRLYIQVKQVDLETAHREFWAAAELLQP